MDAIDDAARAWALREVRLLFPARPLTADKVAAYEAVADVWAHNYARDPEDAFDGLTAKLRFEAALEAWRTAERELRQAAAGYLGRKRSNWHDDLHDARAQVEREVDQESCVA